MLSSVVDKEMKQIVCKKKIGCIALITKKQVKTTRNKKTMINKYQEKVFFNLKDVENSTYGQNYYLRQIPKN